MCMTATAFLPHRLDESFSLERMMEGAAKLLQAWKGPDCGSRYACAWHLQSISTCSHSTSLILRAATCHSRTIMGETTVGPGVHHLLPGRHRILYRCLDT